MGSGTDIERSAERSAQLRDAPVAGLDAWVRAHPWFPDAGLAAALGVALGTTSIVFADGAPGEVRTALVAAVVALHLAVAGRRTWPRAAYAVCCAAMLVLVVLPDLPGDGAVGVTGQRVPPVLLPSSLAFTVLLYSAASRTRHPWPALALGSGLVGAALATARLWQPGEWAGDAVPDGPWRLLLPTALVAVVLAAWGLGRFRAMREAGVEALRERALRAEVDRAAEADRAVAAERERMAREMHDVVAHSIAVMVRQAEGGRAIAHKDPALAVQALQAVADAGREALGDMRSLVDALRPADGRTPDAAPQPSVDDVPALVERLRSSGQPVTLDVVGTPAPLGRTTSLAVYRLVQEALTNVVKHARPGARAEVTLTWGDRRLRVEVVDDGGAADHGGAVDGADAARHGDAVHDGGTTPGRPPDTRPGHGLAGMRERVVLAGGTLEAGPRAHGFAVVAELPTALRPDGPSARSRAVAPGDRRAHHDPRGDGPR